MKPEEPQENVNLYKPDESDEAAQSTSKSGKSKTVSWTASEYIEHQRGASWYGALILGTTVLTAATYFITKDYFAAGIMPILAVIVVIFVRHKPGQTTYEISDRGLRTGDKTYNYSTFKSFSIINEGPLNSLNFYPLKRFMPPISAYFDAKDQDRIVDIIGEHLPLEERGADKLENLSRRLKL